MGLPVRIQTFDPNNCLLGCTKNVLPQIRNPDVSWKEAKRILRKDSRSEVTEMLQKEEKEKMFTEHIEKLAMKKRVKFR